MRQPSPRWWAFLAAQELRSRPLLAFLPAFLSESLPKPDAEAKAKAKAEPQDAALAWFAVWRLVWLPSLAVCYLAAEFAFEEVRQAKNAEAKDAEPEGPTVMAAKPQVGGAGCATGAFVARSAPVAKRRGFWSR